MVVFILWISYIYWFVPRKQTRYRPQVCKEILNSSRQVTAYQCPFKGLRLWKPLREIDPKLRKLVVFLEDAKFYHHNGLDFKEIFNAIEEDLEKGKFARGGSTITQQLVKNIFLSKDKTIIRKLSEVPLALRLEKELTKEQILELYLNTIEWGPGVFGVEAASRTYFDRTSTNLKDEQIWLLALLIPNPKALNPWLNPRSKKALFYRAKQLSNRLVTDKQVSKLEAEQLLIQFNLFLNQWIESNPLQNSYVLQRQYPLVWYPFQKNQNFYRK